MKQKDRDAKRKERKARLAANRHERDAAVERSMDTNPPPRY